MHAFTGQPTEILVANTGAHSILLVFRKTVKAWPIDPLDAESFSLEVSEKLPQG